jgi:hypothetical protein
MAQMLKTEARTLHAGGYSQDVDLPSPFQMLQILYESFIKLSILEPRTPHGSGRRVAKPFSNASNLYKSFTKPSFLESQAPHGSSNRSAKSFSNTSNSLQILYKN